MPISFRPMKQTPVMVDVPEPSVQLEFGGRLLFAVQFGRLDLTGRPGALKSSLWCVRRPRGPVPIPIAVIDIVVRDGDNPDRVACLVRLRPPRSALAGLGGGAPLRTLGALSGAELARVGRRTALACFLTCGRRGERRTGCRDVPGLSVRVVAVGAGIGVGRGGIDDQRLGAGLLTVGDLLGGLAGVGPVIVGDGLLCRGGCAGLGLAPRRPTG